MLPVSNSRTKVLARKVLWWFDKYGMSYKTYNINLRMNQTLFYFPNHDQIPENHPYCSKAPNDMTIVLSCKNPFQRAHIVV